MAVGESHDAAIKRHLVAARARVGHRSLRHGALVPRFSDDV
jgi:hypothetical protein